MSLAQLLWEESADLAQEAMLTSFVVLLASGELPLERFQGYVAQDAFFLGAFARAYGSAMASAPNLAAAVDFSILKAGVSAELRLHQGYTARWGVDLDGVEPDPATPKYTDFLLSTAATTDAGQTTAAMTPCMRLYAHIGQALDNRGVGGENPYAEWVATYSSPEFESQAARLEQLLDRCAADTPPVHATYRRAMELEVQFFGAFSP